MNVRAWLAASAFTFCLPALAITAGQSAPDFSAADTQGRAVKLSALKGKYVVLEWTNPECPFVRNQYNAKSMQSVQGEWAQRVVWLSINSTSEASGEFKTPAKMNQWMQAQGAAQTAIVVDGRSEIARAYAAKTTPEMVVIDPAGTVIYAGAIDDRPTTRAEDTKNAHNYVRSALTEATGGRAVSRPNTTSYGCSIKY
jgi:peroxiredoxin